MQVQFFDGKGTEKPIRKVIFAAANEFSGLRAAVCRWHRGSDAQDGKLSVCMAWGIPKWRTFFMFTVACDSQSSADQRV